MGISGLVEHRNSLLPLIDTRISKNDTLVSLISHVNWSAGWKLLTKLIKRSNSTREHDGRAFL
jgi:hypothetical protein